MLDFTDSQDSKQMTWELPGPRGRRGNISSEGLLAGHLDERLAKASHETLRNKRPTVFFFPKKGRYRVPK